MKTKKLIMMFAMLFCMVAFTACSDDDDSGIYGTWRGMDEDGEVVTVVIDKNSMKMHWDESDGGSETEIYDSFSYDESSQKITARLYKTIYTDPDGSSWEDESDYISTFYVTWIDNNHITFGDHPGGEIWDDFGVLTRK